MLSTVTEDQALLGRAGTGIDSFLTTQRDQGRIAGSYYDDAVARTMPKIRQLFLDAPPCPDPGASRLDIGAPPLTIDAR